ncbi:GntR family transcriptional regulator [Paraburkholderia sp. BL25I1N1]|uniref:GntR family transcriptional regulator n=1 Tax=Paraburkholderia sp. BL25I1N1 TaxID=1938804 RepID=UPI000D48C749|nr:GntR family transcriptional regulator [Paraburkholderia sp. BL25I1N1]PRY05952.1 GntR family transcriptional regulator [Paraburkholderia sp. BL25I1N1]
MAIASDDSRLRRIYGETDLSAQPERRAEWVYQELLRRFVSGQYSFGERISVKDLSAETGVSRQPVMTAMLKLSLAGFVKIRPQVGCEVITPTSSEITDFFLMFGRMESLMAELAATRKTPEHINRLHLTNRQIAMLQESPAASGEAFRVLNRDFHSTIHSAAAAPGVHRFIVQQWEMADFFLAQADAFADHLEGAVAEHLEMIDAIDSGSGQRASQLTQEHIANFCTLVLNRLAA